MRVKIFMGGARTCAQGLFDFFLRVGLLVSLLISFQVARPAQAAIDLISFTATAGNGFVLVEWETATEFDNAGFWIKKSTQANSGFERIAHFFNAMGDGITGYAYSYQDQDVVNGVIYYYILEVVDIHNQSELFGPISVTPGPPTQTPTRTPTPTITPTVTVTQENLPTVTPTLTPAFSATPTRTPSPTATSTTTVPTSTRTPTNTVGPAYPAPDTPVPRVTPTGTLLANVTQSPTATLTISTTQTLSQTATLIPFPTITIQFPEVKTQPLNQESMKIPQPQKPGGLENDLTPAQLSRLGVLVFISIIWVLIGGMVFIFIRRISKS